MYDPLCFLIAKYEVFSLILCAGKPTKKQLHVFFKDKIFWRFV